MPIHDWTRVDAGIFHHFSHGWIEELKRNLNNRGLPDDHYALVQPFAGTLASAIFEESSLSADAGWAITTVSGMPDKQLRFANPGPVLIAETDLSFYRRKQNSVVIRHVSGDRIIAVIEIVSPGNKASQNPLRAFVEKAAQLLDNGIHLLIIDLLPPGRRDPRGIHGCIWEEVAGDEYSGPPEKRLTLAAYESGLGVKAYVVHAAVGDALTDMPVFLERGKAVMVPLEATYAGAVAAVPRRWRRVLEGEV